MRAPNLRGAGRHVLYALSRRVQTPDDGRVVGDGALVPVTYGGVDEEDPKTVDLAPIRPTIRDDDTQASAEAPVRLVIDPTWPSNAPACTCSHWNLAPVWHRGGCPRTLWRVELVPPKQFARMVPVYRCETEQTALARPGYDVVHVTTSDGRSIVWQVPDGAINT
jgi:hypothetical protein